MTFHWIDGMGKQERNIDIVDTSSKRPINELASKRNLDVIPCLEHHATTCGIATPFLPREGDMLDMLELKLSYDNFKIECINSIKSHLNYYSVVTHRWYRIATQV